jgi:hypothetical protein
MYDPNLAYDPAEPCITDQDLLNRMASIGIVRLCSDFRCIKREEASAILSSEKLLERYKHVFTQAPHLLTNICWESTRYKINLYNTGAWKSFLDESFATLIKDGVFVSEALRTEQNFLNIYASWNENVNWMKVYNSYFSRQKSNSYVSNPFIKTLSEYFRTNPLCARSSIDVDLFEATSKPDANVRSEMYKAYISAGFLDKKKARKIRSETSEWASNNAVKHLLEISAANQSLYPNIDDLILQFADTRHQSVQETIAQLAPFRILYAFVGFDSRYAKSYLEQRMQNGK